MARIDDADSEANPQNEGEAKAAHSFEKGNPCMIAQDGELANEDLVETSWRRQNEGRDMDDLHEDLPQDQERGKEDDRLGEIFGRKSQFLDSRQETLEETKGAVKERQAWQLLAGLGKIN